MLSSYPLLFGSTPLLFPTSWNEKYTQIENVNVSEAGTDIVQISRTEKLTLSLSYKITGSLLPTFEYYRKHPAETISVSIWDAEGGGTATEGYVVKTMRMRNFSKTLARKSQELGSVNGVWDISFDLIEM